MTEAHSTRAHARLAPSSRYIWRNCPGSVALSDGLDEPPSPFANEGTAAHMLAQQCLESGQVPAAYRGALIDVEAGDILSPGAAKADGLYIFEVDAEMVDGVQLYLDVVYEIFEQAEEYEIEQRLDNSDLVDGLFGTGDAVAFRTTPSRRLTVCDLKYGKGVAVEVDGNSQLLTYAGGLARRYHNRGVEEVELVIVQPRAPHRDGRVRRWVTDIVGLYEDGIALQEEARRVADPNAPRIPGRHCKFCKAAAICHELKVRVGDIVGFHLDAMGNPAVADVTKYNDKDLAQAWRDREIVKGWCNSVERFAHSEAVAGRTPPGLKLVQKDKHRAWKDKATAVMELELFGLTEDQMYEPRELRSPAKIEKELPPKIRKNWMDALAEKPKTHETVLAELDDPRPSVDATSGFEAIETGA